MILHTALLQYNYINITCYIILTKLYFVYRGR